MSSQALAVALFIFVISLFIAVSFMVMNFFSKTGNTGFKYFNLKGGVFYVIFLICLFMALFSSLISALIGVKSRLNKRFNSNLLSCIGSITLACILSMIGFTNFVSIVYPIIGVVNFIIYVFL